MQIGNLFVSATITGMGSWQPIVEQEAGNGRRDFTVLTGRHGDQYGQLVEVVSGAFGAGVADPAHYLQDLATSADLQQALGIHIRTVDVGSPPYNNVQALKMLTLGELNAGRTVILAWCFSILCMLEHPSNPDLPVPDVVLRSYMTRAVSTTVAALVAENFFWAPAKKWPTVQSAAGRFRSAG